MKLVCKLRREQAIIVLCSINNIARYLSQEDLNYKMADRVHSRPFMWQADVNWPRKTNNNLTASRERRSCTMTWGKCNFAVMVILHMEMDRKEDRTISTLPCRIHKVTRSTALHDLYWIRYQLIFTCSRVRLYFSVALKCCSLPMNQLLVYLFHDICEVELSTGLAGRDI